MSHNKLTTKTFIEKAVKIHDYDYSLVNYVLSQIKVDIICKTHGVFSQTPNNHLRGSRCPKCVRVLDIDSFIKKASSLHANKYDYSKTIYIKNSLKVEIICKIHGSFYQTPNCHLDKKGCHRCGGGMKKSTAEFINQSKIIHNGKYDYSKVEYKRCNHKVNIICPKHGTFWQIPSHHLRKHACPSCSHTISKPEISWLNSLNIQQSYRNKRIKVLDRIFNVDALDTSTNTIYEFYGDFWHGNPKIFKPEGINYASKKKFGELYNNTINRENFLKDNGFNVVSIWESDYNNK